MPRTLIASLGVVALALGGCAPTLYGGGHVEQWRTDLERVTPKPSHLLLFKTLARRKSFT